MGRTLEYTIEKKLCNVCNRVVLPGIMDGKK